MSDVSIDIKLAYWNKVEALFKGLLFDSSKSELGVTPLAELIQTNQRMLIFAADYKGLDRVCHIDATSALFDRLTERMFVFTI